MKFSRIMIGDLCAFTSCGIWALFPVVMHENFNPFQPIFTAGLSTLAAGVLFGILLIFGGKSKELCDYRAWKPIIYSSILIGVCFYGLLFTGARYTNPGNVSLLGLLEIVVAFLFLGRREKSSRRQFFGAILMMSGAAYLICPGSLEMNIGDVLVISACFFAPYGNLYMKEARGYISSVSIMFLRSMFAGVVLLIMGLLTEGVPTFVQIQQGLKYIFISGIILMGVSKLFWIEALIRIPIPKATAFAAFAPAVTLIASVVILGLSPTANQLISLAPMCFGMIIVVSRKKSIKDKKF